MPALTAQVCQDDIHNFVDEVVISATDQPTELRQAHQYSSTLINSTLRLN